MRLRLLAMDLLIALLLPVGVLLGKGCAHGIPEKKARIKRAVVCSGHPWAAMVGLGAGRAPKACRLLRAGSWPEFPAWAYLLQATDRRARSASGCMRGSCFAWWFNRDQPNTAQLLFAAWVVPHGLHSQVFLALLADPVPQCIADRAGVFGLALDALTWLQRGKKLVIAARAKAALLWNWIVGHLQVTKVDGRAANFLCAGDWLGGCKWAVCLHACLRGAGESGQHPGGRCAHASVAQLTRSLFSGISAAI